MHVIQSAHNPRIRALRVLATAKGRAQAGCFLVEGVKLCEEAFRDATVVTLLGDAEKAHTLSGLLARAEDVLLCPTHVFNSVSTAKTPQGILAAVKMPPQLVLGSVSGALLALDGVQDPGNVGAMIRTAEAAGFRGVLLSDACADAFSPKTVRASMGSVLRLPIWRGNLPEGLASIKRQGYAIICSALHGEAPGLVAGRLRSPYALVIGSEGGGISADVFALSATTVTLPMQGRVESLNAAVAAGILMYCLMEPGCVPQKAP